jgi:phage tail-like protein
VPAAEINGVQANFNFLVEIDGIGHAGFQECSGFNATTDAVEHREQGLSTRPHRFRETAKRGRIVLKSGVTADRTLLDWWARSVRGEIERKNGSVVPLDRLGEGVGRWNFERAWPSKWVGPDLNAESNEIAIEELELTHEGIERVS